MVKKTIPFIVISLFIGICLGILIGIFLVSSQSPATVHDIPPAPKPLTPAVTASPTISNDLISFLFIQEAQTGSCIKDGNGTMTITLNGVRSDTVYFSDRPARVSGVIDTTLFDRSSLWSGSSSPNAAVMLVNAPTTNDTIIVTLSNPRYDKANATLVYTATMVPEYHGEGLKTYEQFADPGVAEQFDRVMLFIDNGSLPLNLIGDENKLTPKDILIFP